MTSSAPFTISSFCAHGGCVAVARGADGVQVRSSRAEDGPVLRFTHDEWTAFLAGVRNGEFDLGPSAG